MLATINGEVTEMAPGGVIIELAGLGYQVSVPTVDLEGLEVGKTTKLYLHHHLREDSDDLYGFLSLAGKLLFEQLLSVSGVGPKVALSIMSAAPPPQLSAAIAGGNGEILQGVGGVGKKMAARIMVDLKSKISSNLSSLDNAEGNTTFVALKQLGFSAEQARSVLSKIAPSIKSEEDRLRAALKELAQT